MASSQIRQFATLIDQLPYEADELVLMGNAQNYNKCFDNAVHMNNSKNFSAPNSNVDNYQKYKVNNSMNGNKYYVDKNVMPNYPNEKNKNINEYKENVNNPNCVNKYNMEHMNQNAYLNEEKMNSCKNNNYYNNHMYENNAIKNMKNINEKNLINFLFTKINDLSATEMSKDYLEKLKGEIEEKTCKYLANKENYMQKNPMNDMNYYDNECVEAEKNYRNKEKICRHEKIMYEKDKCQHAENEDNIVYRYDVNACSLNNLKCNKRKEAEKYIQAYMKNPERFKNEMPMGYIEHLDKGEHSINCISNTLYANKGNMKENKNCCINEHLKSGCINDNIINVKELYMKLRNMDRSRECDNQPFDMNEFYEKLNKDILMSKKAKIIKIDSNKSLIIFPVHIHEYGEKYIAVNQRDLLEYICSCIDFDGEDMNTLKAKLFQKEKEIQNVKSAYSMQTTNIHYLINRVIFKECEYEQLKQKTSTLEHEIHRLIQEMDCLISNKTDGVYMQKLFIDYKSKCILKLQELQPLLGTYYDDIFQYITSCRTIGQLSTWIPAFETKNDSLEDIANNLIKTLVNGLGAPINTAPQYFISNKNKLKNSISFESEDDNLLNLAKQKMVDSCFLNNLQYINTSKENNSLFSNCPSFSLNSDSSFLGAEDFFFNSSKFPSMHSLIFKNQNNNQNDKPFTQFNRSITTPDQMSKFHDMYIKQNNRNIDFNNYLKNKNNGCDNLIADKTDSKRKKCSDHNMIKEGNQKVYEKEQNKKEEIINLSECVNNNEHFHLKKYISENNNMKKNKCEIKNDYLRKKKLIKIKDTNENKNHIHVEEKKKENKTGNKNNDEEIKQNIEIINKKNDNYKELKI